MARWGKIQSRGLVQDRRGMKPVMAGGVGTVGVILFVALAAFGEQDIAFELLEQMQQPQYQQQAVDNSQYAGQDEYEVFVSTVLGSNNDLWRKIFDASNLEYREPTLVLFRQATQSACGGATSQVGPHYCPPDETIYIDEIFFDELKRRYGARGGDVAEAYVIAHEVGHHVQNILGINEEVRVYQRRNPSEKNQLSIAQELQADCFAGMWAHSLRNEGVFEEGEILEAMDAAEAVGDDRIQESINGRVDPESWTHGSSEDRKKWFTIGYDHGSYELCNTFK